MQNQITQNWQRDNLENLLDILVDHRGITPKKLGGDWLASGIPALSAKNIKTGQIVNEQDIRFVSQKLYEKWMPEKLEDGDILLTSEAPLGELYFLKEKKDYVLSQRLFALRTNRKKLNSRYLYYYLQGSIGHQELLRRLSGTAAEGIRQAELRRINVEFPEDILEQEKIAAILFVFDNKIEVNNKIAKVLEEMAQVLFKEWFINFKFPGYEKVDFIDSELGRIPKIWRAGKLGDTLQFIYGKGLKENMRSEGEVLVIGSSGIVGHHNQRLVKGPGIVVGRKGNVGSILWIDDDFYPIDTTFYIQPDFGLHYCYFLLKRQKFITGDSAVPGLNREIAYGNTVIIPDQKTVDEFEEIVEPMFAKLATIKNENQKLAALRDLLLPKLMKGEIRV